MDRDILERLAGGEGPAAIVTIVDVKGSAPRHPGASMLVSADGSMHGTVGGGRGEATAIEAARAAIASGRSSFIEVEMLGEDPEAGDLICGGVNRMLVEHVGDRAAWRRAGEAVASGRRVLVVRDLSALASSGRIGTRVFEAGGMEGSKAGDVGGEVLSSGKAKFLEDRFLFLDAVMPREKLVILGGGHVGLAIARAARGLGFAITVMDDRAEFTAAGRFDEGVATVTGEYRALVERFPFDHATFAVIVTRGHLLDLECARSVLVRDFRYAGLIGSRKKIALIRHQLKDDGLDDGLVSRLRAPIGLDLGAETPEEIAVSILAEIVARRHDRTPQDCYPQ